MYEALRLRIGQRVAVWIGGGNFFPGTLDDVLDDVVVMTIDGNRKTVIVLDYIRAVSDIED